MTICHLFFSGNFEGEERVDCECSNEEEIVEQLYAMMMGWA